VVYVSSWGDKQACPACESFFASQRFSRLATHFLMMKQWVLKNVSYQRLCALAFNIKTL